MNWCLVSAFVFIGAIASGPQRSPLRFDEWHHEYIGLAACALGQATHSRFLVTTGAFIAADDAEEHLFQRINNNTTIESPLGLGYQLTIGRLKPVIGLNIWLDRAMRSVF